MEGCNVQDGLGIGFLHRFSPEGFPIPQCKCRGRGYLWNIGDGSYIINGNVRV